VHDMTAIIALAPAKYYARDDTNLRKATGRVHMSRCHHGHFLHEHMLMPERIGEPTFHPGCDSSAYRQILTLMPSMGHPRLSTLWSVIS
jgi:hypothetical protein